MNRMLRRGAPGLLAVMVSTRPLPAQHAADRPTHERHAAATGRPQSYEPVTDTARGLRRRVRSMATGALVGAAIGALGGYVIHAAACAVGGPPCDPGDEVINGALVGGAVGAVVGLVFDLPQRNGAMRRRSASLHIAGLPLALVARISVSP